MPNSQLGLTYASYKDEPFLTANMQIWLKDRAVDQVFNGVVLFKWLTGRDQENLSLNQVKASGALEYRDGGQSIDVPLLTGTNSTVQSYHQYQTIDTTPQAGIGPAMVDWREYAVTVTISKFEELVNMDSKSRVINLLKTKQLQAEKSIVDRLNSDLWKGDPNNTAGAPISKTNTTDIDGVPYWVESVPTSANTIAGIAQATNSFWQNKVNAAGGVVGLTPSFAAEGKNDIQLLSMEASGGPGLDEVDAYFTTKTVFNYMWDSLEDMRRYSSGDTGDVGYKRLSFQGVPVYWDPALSSAVDSAGNSFDVVYGLNSDYWKLVVHRDAFMKSEGFRSPTNQTAKTAIIMCMLNLVCMSRRRQFLLFGIAA